MFSKTCEYAIRIMIHLASKRGEDVLVGVDEIAEVIGSPRAFTAKILQQLTRAGLLESLRGRGGGFVMPAKSISLSDVVTAIDGERVMTGCILGLRTCSEQQPCPVHHKFKPIREMLVNNLNETSMEELKGVMDTREVFLMLE